MSRKLFVSAVVVLFSLYEIKAEIIVTNSIYYCDGFGAQFRRIISSVIYAELHNYKFVYTPFKQMQHNYNNEADFLEKKEWLINFINNFELYDVHKHPNVDSGLHHVEFCNNNMERFANSFSLKKIREIFRSNKKTTNIFNNNNLNIAIHIRRPNPHDDRIGGTDTPDDLFIAIINRLRYLYSSQNPLFHLYSQGNQNQFEKFKEKDVVFHMDQSIEETFISMVFADILVTGTSAFGYVAGLLSENKVYYTPFWGRRLPHWKSVEELTGLQFPRSKDDWL